MNDVSNHADKPTTDELTSPGELMIMLLLGKDEQIDKLRSEAARWRAEAIKLGHSGHLT